MSIYWNYWILANYAGAVMWWAYHANEFNKGWWNSAYWLCAFGITAVVTFGLQPK